MPGSNVATEPYGWDWSATTHAGRDGLVNDLCDALGASVVIPGKGSQGWAHSVSAYDSLGHGIGAVYFGGGRDDVQVVSTSEEADLSRVAVTHFDPECRTSRVDTRVDTLVPWDDLVGVCEDAASMYGSLVTEMSSRRRGESLGRTLYLGAPSSAVRVRLYEKWLESPGQYVDGTNRVEVQLRPGSRVKQRVTGWSPAETFCASRTTQALATALGADLVPAASLHVDRGVPDLERTLQVMGEQYGPAVERWLAVSAGDVDTVVDRLLSRVPGSRLDAGSGALRVLDPEPVRGEGRDGFGVLRAWAN